MEQLEHVEEYDYNYKAIADKINKIIDIVNQNEENKSNAKAILEYNIEGNKDDFTLAVKGEKYYSCLWDFSQYLRELIKYGDLPEKEYDIIEKVREKFYEILEDNQCSLDDVA